MATIRSGEKKALLVIDVQNGVVQNAYDRSRIVSNIARVVQKSRVAKIPVIFVQHINDEELPEGSLPWQIVEELKVVPGDYRITKRYNSAFERTELGGMLEEMGVSELIVTGAATNWCIRATSFGALTKGYDVTLISDAHTTDDVELPEGVLSAKNIIKEFNLGIKYVEYPDLRTTVVSTDEFLLR